MGLTILSVGLVLIIIGLVWFFKSKQQLMLKWEKWEKARLKKVSKVFFIPVTYFVKLFLLFIK